MHRPAILAGLIGALALLMLVSLPLAAQDDTAPPAPVVMPDPESIGLPPAPDLAQTPEEEGATVFIEVIDAPEAIPDPATQEGATQQLAEDQLAACRSKGRQTVRIDNTTTTWASAWTRLVPPPPGGILVVGNIFTRTQNYPMMAAVKFNFSAQNLPPRSQLCEAQARIERTGSYVKGSISPNATQLAGSWSPGVSFNQLNSVPRGAAMGHAGFSGSTLVIEAKSAAQSWLANPGQNRGFLVQSTRSWRRQLRLFPPRRDVLELKIQCDFYNPTSWVQTNYQKEQPGELQGLLGR